MLRQIIEITWMNLQAIQQRLGTSLVITVGIAGVVAVVVSVLAMATGLTDTLKSTGEADRVIVMRKGAIAETLSSLSRDAVLAVETAPGIDETGPVRAVSPEAVISINIRGSETESGRGEGARTGGAGANGTPVLVRGLTESGLIVRPEIQLIDGRMFKPGLYEVIVGEAMRDQIAGLEPGSQLSFRSNLWTVVGIFSTGGDLAESQFITDAATIMSASNRTAFNSVTVRLADVEQFEAFKESVESNPQLQVQADLESEYYERQSESVGQILYFVAYVVGSIMALGALFGAVNTMYTAVSARTVEIATLRALGFGGFPIVVSVLIEALVLAVSGGFLGAAIAWVMFNGSDFATGQLARIAVELEVSGTLVAVGVSWSVIIGLLGGLFPAVRAARIPVIEGLRVSV